MPGCNCNYAFDIIWALVLGAINWFGNCSHNLTIFSEVRAVQDIIHPLMNYAFTSDYSPRSAHTTRGIIQNYSQTFYPCIVFEKHCNVTLPPGQPGRNWYRRLKKWAWPFPKKRWSASSFREPTIKVNCLFGSYITRKTFVLEKTSADL